MKTIKVFENIDELIRGFTSARSMNDDFPVIPYSVSLVSNNDGILSFVGDDSEKFKIDNLDYYDLLDKVLEIQGIRYVHTKSS